MKRFAIALLIGVIGLAGAAVASESGGQKGLVKSRTDGSIERKGVSFATMLSRLGVGRKKPAEVEYSLAWIDAQPKATGDAQFSCLSEALYFEARGETVRGQFAVAEVIMNRVASTVFPDSVCGVIHQGTGRLYQCQFTYTCDGHKDTIAEKQAYARVAKVARAVLDGHAGDLTQGATYYHTKNVSPSWARRFTKTAAIGVHYFYRRPDQRASNE